MQFNITLPSPEAALKQGSITIVNSGSNEPQYLDLTRLRSTSPATEPRRRETESLGRTLRAVSCGCWLVPGFATPQQDQLQHQAA